MAFRRSLERTPGSSDRSNGSMICSVGGGFAGSLLASGRSAAATSPVAGSGAVVISIVAGFGLDIFSGSRLFLSY
jgi:hypothetical protein